MSKYTPGPWSVADLPHAVVVQTESPSKSKYGASRYAAIGGFDRGNPEQLAEALANARLIAASPELLDALDALLSACELPGDHCEIEQALPKARAAIAKATGEQS